MFIIATPIIADILRDNPALRGFAQMPAAAGPLAGWGSTLHAIMRPGCAPRWVFGLPAVKSPAI
jgi:hypothetical protein